MKILTTAVLSLAFASINAQTAENFLVEVEEMTFSNAPGVQSFVHAQHNDKLLIIGGRTEGLHQRQPFAAFTEPFNNTVAYVLDLATSNTYSTSLNVLPQAVFEQLQSTNMEFEQRDSLLYIIGGYGFSSTANDHITYPNLTAVHVPDVIDAIVHNTSIVPYFRQISDTRLQVTGGYLDRLDNTFYLCGGQMFEGRYNPQGPNHGPGFTQEYTNAIKKFNIDDDGTNLSISNYNEWIDTVNLHRRDYNMAVQIFPDGYVGLTMFSGVFQYGVDLPWLNTVDVRDTGYHVRPIFNQYLNQYHTAHMPVFDGVNTAMHSVFFGGMSRYTLDASGQLIDDTNVPFVNTISKTTRFSDDSMDEFKIGEMPGLLGSGAEFIHIHANFTDDYDIIHLDSLPYSKTHVGYVVGGIESTQANIFFINDGTQSSASNRIFKVYITRGQDPNDVVDISGDEFFSSKLYPNPANNMATLELSAPHTTNTTIEILDASGRLIKKLYNGNVHNKQSITITKDDLAAGTYLIRIANAEFSKTIPLVFN